MENGDEGYDNIKELSKQVETYDNGNTETFYREIIAKVTEKMKEEYNNEGIGEDTLLLMKKVIIL